MLRIYCLSNVRHVFSEVNTLKITNPAIKYDTATNFLFNQIKSKLKSEKINIWDSNYSPYCIVLSTDSPDASCIISKFVHKSFGKLSYKEIKTKYVKHYVITINIYDIENLMKFLNQQALYPLYKAVQTRPVFDGNNIILTVPSHLSLESVKKIINSSNIVSIRYNMGKEKMKTYEGKEVSVSEPIFQGSWGDPVIHHFSIHDTNLVVMHLSASAVEKLNELRSIKNGYTICFEVGGVVYATFTLRSSRSIPSDMQFTKCQDKKEAAELIQKLNIGLLSAFQILEQKTSDINNLWLMYILIAICLLLIGVFLLINRKLRLTISMFIALILYLYFGYSKSFIDINMLMTCIIQQLIFIAISKYDEKFNLFGPYITIFYFLISVLFIGYASLMYLYFIEFLFTRAILSSLIILFSYNIIRAFRFKSDITEINNK